MKKLVVTLSILFIGLTGIQAQEAPNAYVQNQAATMTNKITTICHLTTDQVAKITPFVQQFVQTRVNSKRNLSHDSQGMRIAMKADRQQLKSQLQTVLSPAQMTALTNYYNAHKADKGASSSAAQQK